MKSTIRITTLLIAAVTLVGCATPGTVLCITPAGEFEPGSGAELFQEINRQMPFSISPRQFLCKPRSGGLVAWVVVRTDKQKVTAKQRLLESSRLRCSQVEALTPGMAAVIEANWRESQTVKPPGDVQGGGA